MADVTGSYTKAFPVISQNTDSILKYRAQFYNGTNSISLPLRKGTRYIIKSVITDGDNISIGFGTVAGTILDTRFTFTQTAGPLDLSRFFGNAPFSQYVEKDATNVYLIITGTGAITASVIEYTS